MFIVSYASLLCKHTSFLADLRNICQVRPQLPGNIQPRINRLIARMLFPRQQEQRREVGSLYDRPVWRVELDDVIRPSTVHRRRLRRELYAEDALVAVRLVGRPRNPVDQHLSSAGLAAIHDVHGAVAVERVLDVDARAAGGFAKSRSGDLVPAAHVVVDVEDAGGLGIEALSIPRRVGHIEGLLLRLVFLSAEERWRSGCPGCEEDGGGTHVDLR